MKKVGDLTLPSSRHSMDSGRGAMIRSQRRVSKNASQTTRGIQSGIEVGKSTSTLVMTKTMRVTMDRQSLMRLVSRSGGGCSDIVFGFCACLSVFVSGILVSPYRCEQIPRDLGRLKGVPDRSVGSGQRASPVCSGYPRSARSRSRRQVSL